MKKQNVLDVGTLIIWQPSARHTEKDQNPDARNASWNTLPTSARLNVNPITQRLKRRQTSNSKERMKLKGCFCNILI